MILLLMRHTSANVAMMYYGFNLASSAGLDAGVTHSSGTMSVAEANLEQVKQFMMCNPNANELSEKATTLMRLMVNMFVPRDIRDDWPNQARIKEHLQFMMTVSQDPMTTRLKNLSAMGLFFLLSHLDVEWLDDMVDDILSMPNTAMPSCIIDLQNHVFDASILELMNVGAPIVRILHKRLTGKDMPSDGWCVGLSPKIPDEAWPEDGSI